ncbi:ABC transporter substrate-binding protein [Bosea sp. RAF48]|uniref:ABC transporter substrate-binding protein n=1 Tax=Bosea sp. RAF48 TaxID=3237480 RepID=UPI003F8FF24C
MAAHRLAKNPACTVYVDFRHAPLRNTEPSLRSLGRLFGNELVADALIAFRKDQIARVTGPIAGHPDLKRPLVMLDRIPGFSDACCVTFGNENFGLMVEMAGGRNLGSELLPGTFGTINPETIITREPDVVIATGGNWDMLAPGGGWVGLGPGADLSAARSRLEALAKRPAFAHGKAVAERRVFAIWHQFYNSPTSSWHCSASQAGFIRSFSATSTQRRRCGSCTSAFCRSRIGLGRTGRRAQPPLAAKA